MQGGEVGEAGAGEACNNTTSLWDVGSGAKGTQQHVRHHPRTGKAGAGGEPLAFFFVSATWTKKAPMCRVSLVPPCHKNPKEGKIYCIRQDLIYASATKARPE